MNVRNPNVLLARPLHQKPGPNLPTLPDALPNPDADRNMQFKKKKNRKKNTARNMNLKKKKWETSKGDQHLLSFSPGDNNELLAVMSCCFTSPKPESRPCKVVTINGHKVRALLDTGSSISLINSSLKKHLLPQGSNMAKAPMVKLCGAGGKELTNLGCYSLHCSLGKNNYWHNLTFIDKLQQPCIIGMDLLSKVNITIDAGRQTITYGRSKPTPFAACTSQKFVLEPYSETQIKLTAPKAFSQGLIESSSSLPEKVLLMDRFISSSNSTEHLAVIATFSHLPVSIPANTLAGKLTIDPNMICSELTTCLNINMEPPSLTDSSHVDKISLSHLPPS